jgi:hypothetical protein
MKGTKVDHAPEYVQDKAGPVHKFRQKKIGNKQQHQSQNGECTENIYRVGITRVRRCHGETPLTMTRRAVITGITRMMSKTAFREKVMCISILATEDV